MKQRYISGFVLLSLAVLGAGAAQAQGAAEILREGTDGFTVRVRVPEAQTTRVDLPQGSFLDVRIPGYFSNGSALAGRPDLPVRGFPFSIPEGMSARIAGVRIVAEDRMPGPPPLPVPHRTIREVGELPDEDAEYRPDPAFYGTTGRYPRETVTLGPVMNWRFHRVQSVVVSPITVSLGDGSYERIRELEIDVRFVPETTRTSAVRTVPLVEDAPGWDRFFDGTLLNAASARAFRRRPVAVAPELSVLPGQTLIRLRVGTSGPVRMSFEDLSAAGYPAGIPVGEVRVEERGYVTNAPDPFSVANLPRRLEDENGSGTFDEGDTLFFYALNVKDRFDPAPHEARYGYFHSYWVTNSPAGGRDFTTMDGFPAGTDYVIQDRFRETLRVEKDLYYVNNPQDTGSLFFPTSLGLYWLESKDVDVRHRFDLPQLAPGGSVRVSAEWHGRDLTTATINHVVSLELNGTRILDDSLFTGLHDLTWVGPLLGADTLIVSGQNEMRILARSSLPNLSGAAFDWFQVVYDRAFIAANDFLLVTTDFNLGKVEYEITGFTSPDIVVLDITDPVDPQVLDVTPTGGPGDYRVRVRVNATGVTRKIAAFVPGRFQGLPDSPYNLPPDLVSTVAEGLPRDLIAAGAGSDLILITHPALTGWDPWVAQRESEGHQVFVCDVLEIYDQFSGGDKTPWGIQRFLSHAFQSWDPAPSYVLLGGDANEDYRQDTAESDIDWVPTMMHISNVPGAAGREMTGTDNWYVSFLNATDPTFDVLPDMHVGRLPVATPGEVQTIVQKLMGYATMNPEDDWRRRGVFLSDDQYSTSLSFTSGYCWRAQELSFRATTEAVCDSILQVGRLASFTCDTLFLNAYLDTVDALLRNPGSPQDCPCVFFGNQCITHLGETSRYARDHVTPILIEKLNRGCLVWEFTGHANKALITTEQIIQSRRGLSPDDVSRINNLGKPFVFYGYACHLAEFEDARVNNRAGGDAIGEALLLAPNRGAIGVVASTGYEWLYTNPEAQLFTSRYMFWDLPRDPATGRPRRILGETHSWAFGSLVLSQNDSDHRGMMRTYVLLGDPSLRMDIQTADFQVTVDGVPVSDMSGLFADSATDSLTVRVVVSDDVDVDTLVVREGNTVLPADRITIVGPGARDRGLQSYEATFRVALRPSNYDLVIEAEDWLGRMSSFTLPVRFDVVFMDEDENIIQDQDHVDPGSDVRVDLLSPVGLEASDLLLLVDGVLREGIFIPVADTTGRRWTAVAPGPWSDGAHRLEVRVAGTNELLAAVDFTTTGGPLTLFTTYAYPNPYEDPSPGPGNPLYFVYELSRRGDRAEVAIFTVKGRRVLRRELPAQSSRNAFRWDLRDEAGDLVANGVYLFRLTVFGEDGRTIERLERVAVSR